MHAAPPTVDRWFEDYPEGAVFDIGEIAVDEQEVLEFARRFDPQPFHTDPEAAAASHFGGIIASGWHTASLMMRLLATNFLSPVSSLGSPGVDELRWLQPVRPGDVLQGRVTVLSARRSASKPDRGVIESRIEMQNQRGETVFSTRAVSLLRCRADA
jgi:acyl dehydratase